MADTKISSLTASGAIADGDLLPIVDVSDTTDSAAGSTRKITKANLTTDLAPKASPTFTGTVTAPTVLVSGLTASEIVITDASKNLASAAVATYPSLTELTYVKGVTSAIQTQLGTKVTSGGALGTPSSGTLTNCTGLPVAGITASTSTALGVGSIELGHATDTTIARASAGVASIEGNNIVVNTSSPTLATITTTGNIELGHASDTTISRVSAGVIAVEGVNVLTTAGGTLTGNITLGENTAIALDPAGSADGKYSGITITGTAGTTLAFGDLVYLAAADSRWELADADAATTADRMLGMCVLAAGADGNATNILLMGNIRADAAFPALTIGSPVYVGEIAGDIQVAIPTGADNVIRRVGYALTADELYFNPSMDAQTTVA